MTPETGLGENVTSGLGRGSDRCRPAWIHSRDIRFAVVVGYKSAEFNARIFF
jgi:hypothetical protein